MNDIEKRFYDFMIKNTIPSALNRSASALEKLNTNTEALTSEIKNASSSSTKLSKSLNRLTLVAVIIAALALAFEGYKLYLETSKEICEQIDGSDS